MTPYYRSPEGAAGGAAGSVTGASSPKTSIPIRTSKMRMLFRVVARVNVVVFESAMYVDAERFCWDYEGPEREIHIERVWVPKETTS